MKASRTSDRFRPLRIDYFAVGDVDHEELDRAGSGAVLVGQIIAEDEARRRDEQTLRLARQQQWRGLMAARPLGSQISLKAALSSRAAANVSARSTK